MNSLYKLLLSVTGLWGMAVNVLLALLSGLASFLFISVLNFLMSRIIAGRAIEIDWIHMAYMVIVILTFIVTKRVLGARVVILSQTIFWKLRKQVLALVLNTSYRQIVLKRAEINVALNSDVNALSNASYGIIDFITNVIISFTTLIYLATISFQLFIATIATAFAGILLYSRGQKKVEANFSEAIGLENTYMEKANAILDGFREIFVNPRKGKDIFENDLYAAGKRSQKVNLQAQISMMNGQATVQFLFYLLISSVLLFAARLISLPPGEVIKFLFTLIFMVGSISTVIMQLPGLTRANASYKHLVHLASELASLHDQHPDLGEITPVKDFDLIQIKDIEFRYNESGEGFKIGPFDFNVKRNDCIFIYGGNGSGKTTFLYTLIGVYVRAAGEITLDSQIITGENYFAYRSAFALVSSDFYLFQELYGIERVNLIAWEYYLEMFELRGIVALEGKKFSTTKLSTGQRKRLAIIAALLEEKPILVLDEWAADQDPIFRKKFYTEILPALSARGITIIAITHDDKYYGCASKLYRMEEGLLVQEEITNSGIKND